MTSFFDSLRPKRKSLDTSEQSQDHSLSPSDEAQAGCPATPASKPEGIGAESTAGHNKTGQHTAIENTAGKNAAGTASAHPAATNSPTSPQATEPDKDERVGEQEQVKAFNDQPENEDTLKTAEGDLGVDTTIGSPDLDAQPTTAATATAQETSTVETTPEDGGSTLADERAATSSPVTAVAVDTDGPLPMTNEVANVPLPVARGVFYPAAAILLVLVIAAIAIPDSFQSVIATASSAVSLNLSWYYVLAATGFVGFIIFAAFSRFGDIKLGDDDDEPEYSLGSWFAMLFAAGMGIGLVFYGAGEPLSHFASPRPGNESESAAQLAREAMASTFLHWGFHAWSIYVVVGLAIAYSHFRRKRSISIRWTLEPALGKERVQGKFGDIIDVVAIVGTVLGVATSLGFGVYQVAAGIEYLTGFKSTNTVLVTLVIVISALAAISVATGLDNGIKFLSNMNLIMAAALALAVAALGPTVFILNEFVQDIGIYLSRFIELAFQTLPFEGVDGSTWLTSWTTNYWGWWISWSPFVGIFIARISRGRTIREFIVGVMAVPTLVTFLWFAIMGGNALFQELFTDTELIGEQGVNINTVLFQSFEALPFGQILSGVAMLVVVIFFITSSDSGSFVMSMLSTSGDPNPALYVRLTWATLVGAVTAAILGTSTSDAGMAALQSLAILAALPFSMIMIGMCVSLLRSVRREHERLEKREQKLRRALLVEDVSASVVEELTVGTFPQSSDPRRRSPIPVAPEIADFIRRHRARGRARKRK